MIGEGRLQTIQTVPTQPILRVLLSDDSEQDQYVEMGVAGVHTPGQGEHAAMDCSDLLSKQ